MKRICIIPAAGLATRLRPLSNCMSKTMVPVCGKPILGHIFDILEDIVDEVVVVTGTHTDIDEYVSRQTNRRMIIKTAKQENPVGPLDAIARGWTKVACEDDANVLIWLGDTLIANREEVKEFTSFHKNSPGCRVAVSSVPDWSRWCMAKENDDSVTYFDKPEKQPPTDKAVIGLYWFSRADMFTACMNHGLSDSFEIKGMLDAIQENTKLVEFKSWLDCGDLPSLASANSVLISQKSRAHNSVTIEDGVVTKHLSCDDERNWYHSIQHDKNIVRLMPQYISDEGENGFSIEVCSGNTLQDMLVFDNIRSDAWLHILKRVMKQYLIAFDTCENACEATSDPHYMFHWNIAQRFNQTERQGIEIPYSAKVFLDETYSLLAKRMQYVGMYNVIHGDFHFGNIFYDASCDKVKAIDPRGNWDGHQTTSGYMLYDFAKLLQSVYAGYVWVVSGVPVNEKLRTELTEHIKTFMHPLVFDLAKRYALLLQLSAIPLHYDNPDRQRRMLETSMKYILEQHPL